MDPETVPSTPLITPKPPLPKKLIILGILISLAMTLFSLNYFKIINFKTSPTPTPAPVSQTPPERTIKESQSPVAFSILQNPIVYEWRGSVTGTLTAKTDTSITLTKDGQNIVITVDLNPNYTGTKFFTGKPTNKDMWSGIITLDQIPIGTKLRGDFFVFRDRKDQMIGSSFSIEQ